LRPCSVEWKFTEATALIPTMQDLGLRANVPTLGRQATNYLNFSKAVTGDSPAQYDPGASLNEAEIRLACGENERVAALAEEVLKRPDVSRDNAAANRALIALAKHQPQQAIDVLSPLRHGRADITVAPFRALAYIELNKPAEAAIEFCKLISRKSQSLNLQYGRKHVQLARALAAAANTAEAKKIYEVFFNLLKDADPGTPLLDAALR